MRMEVQIVCGTVQVSKLSGFLKKTNAIAAEYGVTVQGLNSDLIAGERHLRFAVEKTLRAFAEGKNIAKDPGVEIMRYAAGEKQIERSFSIGLFEGENQAVFVVLGKKEKVEAAVPAVKKLVEEKPCADQFNYTIEKRPGILEKFGITGDEIEAAGEVMIPELVLERVALVDFLK